MFKYTSVPLQPNKPTMTLMLLCHNSFTWTGKWAPLIKYEVTKTNKGRSTLLANAKVYWPNPVALDNEWISDPHDNVLPKHDAQLGGDGRLEFDYWTI